MPVAVKKHPINIKFKSRTPLRVIQSVKKQFSNYIIRGDDELEDWFETDLHKEIAGHMKPGDYLRNFREGQGMTQKELGEKIGMRVNYLSDIETGQRAISRMNAKKLAQVFKTSPAVFI